MRILNFPFLILCYILDLQSVTFKSILYYIDIMDKFYFKSYGIEIGSASDLKELKREIKRLSEIDSLCVEYHLKEGHLSSWLLYIGEPEASEKIKGVRTINELKKQLGIETKPAVKSVKNSTGSGVNKSSKSTGVKKKTPK